MKIGKSKYLLSRGLGFYSEYEANRIKKEAAKGWRLRKISRTGFLIFKEEEPVAIDVTIDFYSGKKKEITEYLELYEASGWNVASSYRNRYFIFEAPIDTLSAYTDPDSYEEKIKKENKWLIKQFFIPSVFSLFLLLVMRLDSVNLWLQQFSLSIVRLINIILVVYLLYPVIGLSLIYYFKLIYPKRKEYYQNTAGFAKRQYFWRDMLLATLIGGVIGGIAGFIAGYFNLM